tara:strand:+ start:351 stop:542 length:192 start_codon:yes stop_codon:yes gene_type:complete
MTNDLPHQKIYDFIKTPCGRLKYSELASRKGFLSKVRLYWFIFFATIKDWNISPSNQSQESNS